MTSTMQNEVDLQKIQVGTETIYGTAVTPTFRLGGNLVINRDRPLVAKPTRDGTFNVAKNVKFGTTSFDGTYDDELSFEDMAILPRYAIGPKPTPTSDGNATPGYAWSYKPGQSLFESMAVEHGVDGLLSKAAGVQFNDFTVSWDVDDADGNWKVSGALYVKSDALGALTTGAATGGTTTTIVKTAAGWTANQFQGQFVAMRAGTAANIGELRQVLSNTTDTLTLDSALPSAVVATDTFEIMAAFTSLTSRDVDYIPVEGTQLFIADDVAGLATASNELKDKMIKGSVTMGAALRRKKFTDNIGTYSSKRGRGKRTGSGVITMEFDDWKERANWEAQLPRPRALKVQQINGPTIDSVAGTKKTAAIIVPRLYWDKLTPNNRDGNLTQDYAFGIYHDAAVGYDIEYLVTNALATLP